VKVKKYLVRDVAEAMKMIKEDLGDNAVILSTRKVKKGGWFFGLGAKTFFEVTAVVEDENHKKQSEKPKRIGREDIYKLQEILEKNRQERLQKAITESKAIQASNNSNVTDEMEKIKEMISELKMMVISGKTTNIPPGIEKIAKSMQIHEIDNEVTSKLVEFLRMNYGDIDINNEEIEYKLIDYLRPYIKTEEVSLEGRIIFVGPTGVGKTTTLAKIAARLALEEKKRIAILTLDTYRIAAAEQLKTYASIMNIPIRVAYTPQEARMHLNAMIDYDAILIDTAGRSQKNDLQMRELKAIVDTVIPEKVFLVVSMTARFLDIKDILRKFKEVGPTHVILTKLDETNAMGPIINVPYTSNLPISFITNGQRVPEDIFVANTFELTKMVVKEVLNYARTS